MWPVWVSTLALLLWTNDGMVTIYGVEAEDGETQVDFVMLGLVARISRGLDINGISCNNGVASAGNPSIMIITILP